MSKGPYVFNGLCSIPSMSSDGQGFIALRPDRKLLEAALIFARSNNFTIKDGAFSGLMGSGLLGQSLFASLRSPYYLTSEVGAILDGSHAEATTLVAHLANMSGLRKLAEGLVGMSDSKQTHNEQEREPPSTETESFLGQLRW